MRELKTNEDDSFRVKAYAGTNGVLLAFDLAKRERKGLLGFAVQQREVGRDWEWLWNSLTFPGMKHTHPQYAATPSNQAPFQKFRWGDYVVPAGKRCRYRVHPAYGEPGGIELGDPIEVAPTTSDGKPKGQQVYFNRAVAASQAFGRNFPKLDALLTSDKELPVEKWGEEPRRWLENGLLEAILDFIGRAEGPSWALDIAIYEYELESIVKAVNAAKARGVDLRILYHSKVGDHQTEENEHALKKIPKSQKRGRVTTRIFHDKFIVLSKLNQAGERKPEAVLCGSTNFTENGVYRQANVVHIIDGRSSAAKLGCAGRYLALFEQIWAHPADVAATKKWIGKNNAIDPGDPLFVGFSPRAGGGDLQEFVNVINLAQRDILFATAFALPDDILDALLGQDNDRVLRYGIQNSTSRITGYHADRTAEFVTPALLNKGLEGWVKEGLKGQRGSLLVHTKAIVVNFTSDDPVIISGSHNLSAAASSGNDENYLVIRGDRDLADRYGIEIMRFYEHYRFRFHARKLKLKEVRPLAEDNSWSNSYYEDGNLKQAARLRFAGR